MKFNALQVVKSKSTFVLFKEWSKSLNVKFVLLCTNGHYNISIHIFLLYCFTLLMNVKCKKVHLI